MSEHRRKPPPPQGGGRAAARRGAPGASSGRRAAPRSATGSPSGSYEPSGSYGSPGDDRTYGGRAEARRAAQRSTGGGGRRRPPEGGGGGRRGGGPPGPGRGRGRGGAEPPKKRFIDYPRAGKYGWRKLVPSWKQVTGTVIGFLGLLVAAAGIGYAMVEVPKVQETATAQNNVFYWADGKQMVATGGEYNRQIIPYSKIPKEMRYAVISAENKTFEQDKGIDPMGIGRAVYNMAKGGNTQGGSTITQQYVKNSRLSQDQTLTRKFQELFISIKVGAKMEKKDIMAGYLNTAYYGRGAYGIQAASRAYFDKPAVELNASECALLAAVLKGATYFDPAGNPEIDPAEATREKNQARAEKRWKWILDEQVKDGHLSPSDRDKYKKFPKVENGRSNTQLSGQIGYLVNLAKSYVINNTGITEAELRQGGYEIHTTFEKKKVDELEKAVSKVIKKNIDEKARPDLDTHVQFGGASVDPRTGAIVATYGGEDYGKHFTNNADVTGAQVGSTFKPFVLAAAMRDGVRDPEGAADQPESERTPVSPKSLYSGKNDLKIKNYDGSVWQDENGEQWRQENDGKQSYGEAPTWSVSLREAMQHSVNSPYVQLGMDVGISKVRKAAADAGLHEDSLTKGEVPSVALGIDSPSAIRMAGAYGTFAASGKQNDPYSVKEVKHGGKPVYTHKAETRSPFDSAVADNVTDVLKNVVDAGTGTNAKLPGRDVAGKTGTTDGNKSAWFVGYTPQLSTAVSMYRLNDDEKAKNRQFLEMFGTGGEKKIHGASFPSKIWKDYMETALKGEKVLRFSPPEPIGKKVYGGGAESPSPTPTITEEPEETEEPSATPEETEPTEEPSDKPDPNESCKPNDWKCQNDGGTTDGGTTDGGTDDGGTTDGTTDGGFTDGGTTDGGTTDGGTTDGGTTDGGTDDGGTTDSGGNGNGNGGGWIAGREG
ncbi:transglycosylase domain-containing protein [Streptomyces sp. E11-3]|uniref:transglycosylase domain-containing protein n=1 Tax=Streptomyces sp. E11-3 TaxID=3110112 RepID=UPI003980F377